MSIDERTLKIATYIAETGCTIRMAAKKFGIAKSTLHKDLNTRLPRLDIHLFEIVKKVFDNNFSTRHIRGGESTRLMYKNKKTSQQGS